MIEKRGEICTRNDVMRYAFYLVNSVNSFNKIMLNIFKTWKNMSHEMLYTVEYLVNWVKALNEKMVTVKLMKLCESSDIIFESVLGCFIC